MEAVNELSDPRDRKTYYLKPTLTRRILTPIVKLIFRLIAGIRVTGAENLPRKGPVVLAANHLTNFDVFPVQFVLPRPIYFMGKEELFRNPFMDWLLRQLGGFPVYRGERDQWAIRHAQKVLGRGRVLGIFPEGKRSKGKGLHAAKTGAAHLARGANCPIVPVAVHGTHLIARRFPRRSQVFIHIGKPIYPQEDESPLELIDRIMFSLADMLPAELRGIYASRPPGFPE